MRRHSALPFAILCPLLAGSCGNGVEGTGTNVLLISLDSTRRDLLSAYGRRPRHAPKEATSPSLDRLADEGVVLLDAYATTSWTLPSHVSLMSGEPEVVHGVDLEFHRPDPGRPLLAEILRRAGYRTAGFFSGPYLDPRFGFDRGFDRYEPCYGDALMAASRRSSTAHEALSRLDPARDPAAYVRARREKGAVEREVEVLSHRDVSSSAVVAAAARELEEAAAAGEPFFLFVHFFDPHYDYAPPGPFDRRFDPDYAGTLSGRDFYGSEEIAAFDASVPSGRRRTISERDLDHVKALYEGELAWTDAQIGALLEKLDDLDLEEDTLVIVTADHGDEFFEHDGIGHRRTLFEEVMAVPLILRLPARLPAGVEVEGLVSNADVLPTVLEVLELEPVGGRTASSFLPLIEGRDDGAGRGVFGRIVAVQMLRRIRTASGEREVRGRLFRVQETFRLGSIKITRERAWPEGDDPASVEILEPLRERDRRREKLVWIDLERFPAEREVDHSSDFSDPRARAALREFQDRYRELLRRRHEARLSADDGDGMAQLRGLGYADGGAPVRSDRLALPPPGG